MAYDPIKAHQYYLEYKKKGKKKGRKKATKKSTTTKIKKTNLVGLSTGGLNDQGKMQWALAKEKMSAEMNEALGKASTQEEKDQIRSEYQNKAMAELQKMKGDTSLATAKKEKKATTKSTKSTSTKSTATKAAQLEKQVAQMKEYVSQLEEKLKAQTASLSEEQKEAVKESVQEVIDSLRKRTTNSMFSRLGGDQYN